MSAPSVPFSGVYEMLVDISAACVALYFASFTPPDQIDLCVADWEEARLWIPGLNVASKYLFGIRVQTWSGLKHGEFRLRVGGEVVVDSAD